MAGANNETFEETLRRGYAFYKAIGTTSMSIDRVEPETLYENHDRVRVFYSAGYRKRDGTEVSISFDVLYLLPNGTSFRNFQVYRRQATGAAC